MRQLQKGNQAAQRSDCRRNWLSRVLILRTLWKTDHRVPEETQASSAQDDRIAAPSDSFTQQWTAADGVFFRLAFFPQRKAPRSTSPNFKSQPISAGNCICLRRFTLIGRGTLL